MDLVQLKRFLVSAELGSFGKAAKQLNVTQPALTQSIKSLEALLGEDVFIRGARGVKLTAFGTMLVPRAQLIVNETTRIRDDIATLKTVKNAKLIVGVAPYVGAHIFPHALNHFSSKMPDVALKVVEGQSGDFARMLVINEIDLAFCGYNEVFAHDQALKFDALFRHTYKLVVRGNHPIFHKKRVPTVSDFAHERWVIYDHEPTINRISILLQSAGISPLPDFIKTNSLSLMVSLTRHTDAVSLLPIDFVARELQRGELKAIASSKIEIMTETGILSRRDTTRSAAAKQMMASIVKASSGAGG
jgi:LysR family pca operon transcriptional activator